MPRPPRPQLIPLLLIFLPLTLAGCRRDEPPPAPVIRPVLTQPVKIQAYWREAIYAGEVRARQETALGFRIGGKIIERYVDVGDEVTADTLLAKLDPQDYQLRLLEAEAELAAAQAISRKAAADLERYATLLKRKLISKSDYQDFANAYAVARARLRQAEAQLEVTRNQAGYTLLRADRAGVITAVEAESGQVVAAGQTVLRLADTKEKEVAISIPENRLEGLRRADEITITLWADPDASYRGRIREISPGADPVTRTYNVRVSLLQAAPNVQLGMTATVTVRRRMAGEVARLPLPALYLRKAGQPALWLFESDGGASGRVFLVPVEVAEYRRDAVLIRSGLKNGQRVVVAGVHKLHEGQRVRLMESVPDDERGI